MISPLQTTAWPDALSMLQCPDCRNALVPTEAHIACEKCQRVFEVVDGILVTQSQFSDNNRVVADFYDSASWAKYRFWKRFTPFNETAVAKWRAEVFQHLTELENTRLLDVAIGAGLTIPHVPSSCDLFGIDISIEQLRDCQDDNADRGVKLVLGEAESLPFADNSFDNVLSFGAFNYFNDPLASLQEMARVVKPNGLIVVTDEHPDLPTRMIGHRIGWPALDHWILSRFLHLGADFATLVEDHSDLELDPVFDQVFDSWEASQCCNNVAYCVVGRVTK